MNPQPIPALAQTPNVRYPNPPNCLFWFCFPLAERQDGPNPKSRALSTILFPMAQLSPTFPRQSPGWNMKLLVKLSLPHDIVHNHFMKLLFSVISNLQEILILFTSFSLLWSFFGIWPKNLLDILSSYFEKYALCFCSTFTNSSLFSCSGSSSSLYLLGFASKHYSINSQIWRWMIWDEPCWS